MSKPPPPEGSPPTLTLTVVEGPQRGHVFSFAGHEVFLVGRSKQAQFHVNDGYFSRYHFMVEINPPACRLTDLGSRNGTHVNGQRVQCVDLRDGDVIKAGHTALRLSIPQWTPDGADATLEAHTMTFVAGGQPQPPAAPETRAPGLSPPTVPTEPPTAASFPRVDGYEIEAELGRGGMGVVYRARCLADGTRVALKTITPAVAAHPTQVERFKREASILCQLQHPHIVGCREVGQSGDCLFFVMEYVEGTDASKLLKQQGPLPVRTAVRLLCQLLAALEYAHGKGFVHRDIKPGNVLVASEAGKRAVKLADFGLARVYQESKLSGLTMLGEAGGTLAYMPPEQITQFRLAKPAADQYSAAATLYTLLSGKLLFDFKGSAEHALTLVLQKEPLPLRQHRPDLPEELATAVHRALAKDPEARFPDVRAFRAALMPFAT
jgi:serine/threonine-protein kinase